MAAIGLLLLLVGVVCVALGPALARRRTLESVAAGLALTIGGAVCAVAGYVQAIASGNEALMLIGLIAGLLLIGMGRPRLHRRIDGLDPTERRMRDRTDLPTRRPWER